MPHSVLPRFRRLRGIAAGLAACVAVSVAPASAFAQAAAAQTFGPSAWVPNVWGTPMPRVQLTTVAPTSAQTCATSGMPVLRVDVSNASSEQPDLVLPTALVKGQAYRVEVTMRSAGAEPQRVDIGMRRSGPPFEFAAVRTVTLTPEWRTYTLQGLYVARDPGAVRLTFRDAQSSVCVATARVTPIDDGLVGMPASAQPVGHTFFGVHLNQFGRHHGWPVMPTGIVRLWDSGTTWSELQPNGRPVRWAADRVHRIDLYLDHVRRNDPDSIVLFTLGKTPQWATGGVVDACGAAHYGISSCRAPARLETWRAYVRFLAERYRGVIRHWELWNEADIWVHWNESPEEMVELARVAYEELKEVDQRNMLMGPNISPLGVRFLNRFLAAGGGAHVDALSVHSYFGRDPESSSALIKNVREVQRAYGLDLPIWNTEANVSCNPSFETCTPEAIASQHLPAALAAVRGLLSQAAVGTQAVVYYTWEGASLPYGGAALVEEDRRSPTSTAWALLRALDWIRGATVRESVCPDARLVCKAIVLPNNQRRLSIWSPAGAIAVPRETFPGMTQMRRLSGPDTWSVLPATLVFTNEPVLLSPP